MKSGGNYTSFRTSTPAGAEQAVYEHDDDDDDDDDDGVQHDETVTSFATS